MRLHDHPERMFSVVEEGFPPSGWPTSLLVKKGRKSPHSLIPGSGRVNITVEVYYIPNGGLFSPCIVYTGRRLLYNCILGGPLGTHYSCSANGWMTCPNFIDWPKSLFLTSLTSQHLPLLLVLDGHTFHISDEVQVLACDNNGHFLKLPPHLRLLLQPENATVVSNEQVFHLLMHMWFPIQLFIT